MTKREWMRERERERSAFQTFCQLSASKRQCEQIFTVKTVSASKKCLSQWGAGVPGKSADNPVSIISINHTWGQLVAWLDHLLLSLWQCPDSFDFTLTGPNLTSQSLLRQFWVVSLSHWKFRNFMTMQPVHQICSQYTLPVFLFFFHTSFLQPVFTSCSWL